MIRKSRNMLSRLTNTSSKRSQGDLRRGSIFSFESKSSGATCKRKRNTGHGRKWQILQMATLPLLPLVCILTQAAVKLSWAASDIRKIDEETGLLEEGVLAQTLITKLQNERAMVTLYVSNNTLVEERELLEVYLATDNAINEIQNWPQPDDRIVSFVDRGTFKKLLSARRHNLSNHNSLIQEISFYSGATHAFINWIARNVEMSLAGNLWPFLMTYKELLKCIDRLSQKRALGGHYFARGQLGLQEHIMFIKNYKIASDLLETVKIYDPEVEKQLKTFEMADPAQNIIKNMTKLILKNGPANQHAGTRITWLSNMSNYLAQISQIRDSELKKVEEKFKETRKETFGKCLTEGIALVLSIVVAPLLSFISYRITLSVHVYSGALAERGKELKQEKKRTEELLHQMMPKSVARQLRQGRKVEAEYFECVTVFFSDIVNFKELSLISTPMQLVNLLNSTYVSMDNSIEQYDVYKVETISDVYMISSGVPVKNGKQHVFEIADLALSLLESIGDFKIPHLREEHLQIRIGINTGPCVAGVVGEKMPRYCLFGDTINVAARMQTNSLPYKIQITERTRDALAEDGSYVMPYRGKLPIKGKGEMSTYWLVAGDGRKEHDRGSTVTFKFRGE